MSSFEKVRTAVECILVRSILVPAVLIVGLKIEVMTERLGIDESSAQRRALGILIITLVTISSDHVDVSASRIWVRDWFSPNISLLLKL